MYNIRSILRCLIPRKMLNFRRHSIIKKMWKRNETRPVDEVFSEIYLKNYWGGQKGEFCSGSGSVGRAADAYCDIVKEFIKKHTIRSVVDLGCGDFRVGSKIASSVKSYIGIDLVADLIKHNNINYSSENIHFLCLDAISDDLPVAELCLIRQMFQHLTNKQIITILNKLSCYDYVIVTEHYPAVNSDFKANMDKPHGSDTRVILNSAVALDEPPFNVSSLKLILSVPVSNDYKFSGEVLNTYLFNGNAIGNTK